MREIDRQYMLTPFYGVNADQYLTHQRRFSFDPPPGPWLGFLGRKAS